MTINISGGVSKILDFGQIFNKKIKDKTIFSAIFFLQLWKLKLGCTNSKITSRTIFGIINLIVDQYTFCILVSKWYRIN